MPDPDIKEFTHQEKQDLLQIQLQSTIEYHKMEFELTDRDILGVLEALKILQFCEGGQDG